VDSIARHIAANSDDAADISRAAPRSPGATDAALDAFRYR
jgi:hypothetical protein